jgi:transposase
VHIYYTESRAASDRDEFALRLAKWRDELTTSNEVKKNTWAYNKYFIVKDLPKRGRTVLDNIVAIEKSRKKHMGFFCLLSSYKTNALTAIETYRRKEAVENCFDDLKNMLDMKRLRIHSSPAMDARLFIQFIVSVLLSKLRSVKNQHIKLKHISVRELMELMETVTVQRGMA